MEKQKVTVRVAGKEYTLVSSDSPEHLNRVAAYVDRQMTETSFATRLPAANVAVLVSLNIADELMKAHDENARLRRELKEIRN
ncbi:MAG: cell division protein ZapA [Clostridia bacterium]|nr:cell division protein ZapA [Clostridia bacterium]